MKLTAADIGEFGLIRIIHDLLKREGANPSSLIVGIGDDAASFLPNDGYELLVTCDSMVEGRHYIREYTTPFDLGRRAMVMNISDIGAMGGRPIYGIVSLGLRAHTPVDDVEAMYRGFVAELSPFNAAIIGGNITKSDQYIFIDITLIGEVKRGSMVRRSSARPGDAILVTGYPGQAAAGLRMLQRGEIDAVRKDNPLVRAYNKPDHRANEGRAVAESGYATSMIDISDGLLGDLGHICEESNVGAELILEKLPVSEHIKNMDLSQGETVYDMVMNESDDYELILTCTQRDVKKLCSLITGVNNVPVTEIGRITRKPDGLKVLKVDGALEVLSPRGWDHFIRNEEDRNQDV